jgi:hypothetical protein
MVDTVDLELVIMDGILVAGIANGRADGNVPKSIAFASYSSRDFLSLFGYDAFFISEMYFTSRFANLCYRDEGMVPELW